jgi:putative pyruvate formate lyase activating enzyme
VNRYEKTGHCLIGADVKVSTIAPHFAEEPCITGHNGSWSVFFSGCNLRCVFCQNHDIAYQRNGFDLSPEELTEWCIKLQNTGGVHNINFVTPEHVVPQVVLAILHAKDLGLKIPIIYNTSSFDSLDSIRLLDGLVDIYMPDFKVWSDTTSRRYLEAENYAHVAKESIKEMHSQVGGVCFTPDGIAKSGVLVRHIVMPGQEEGMQIVKRSAENVSKDLYIHIMQQYRPRAHVGKSSRGSSSVPRNSEINRPIQDSELSNVRKAAEKAGLWRFVEAAGHGGFNI